VAMRKIVILSFCIISFSAIGFSQQQTRPSPSMSQEGAKRSAEHWKDPDTFKENRKYKAGQRIVLDTPGNQKVLLGFATVNSITKFQNAADVRDEYGYKELINSGNLRVIEKGASILVLEESYYRRNPEEGVYALTVPMIKARILNGKYKGEALFFLESSITDKKD
jgi:hypothetical protein